MTLKQNSWPDLLHSTRRPVREPCSLRLARKRQFSAEGCAKFQRPQKWNVEQEDGEIRSYDPVGANSVDRVKKTTRHRRRKNVNLLLAPFSA